MCISVSEGRVNDTLGFGLGRFCSKKHSHGFIFIGNPDSGCLPIEGGHCDY